MRPIEEIKADMEVAIASQDTKRMNELYGEKALFYAREIPLFRLKEICQAERDGRCVVLPAPAKEGEKKPTCFYNDSSGIWCLGMSKENDDEPTERCKKCWYCESSYYAEKAEAALKEDQHE